MSHIRKRSGNSHYKTMTQYAEDWRLMFTNARQYNQEGSWVVNDANELQKVFEATFQRETAGTDLPGIGGSGSLWQQSNGVNSSSYTTPAPVRKVKKRVESDDDYVSD
jgi:ATP-dependent helicase STH1/SNF2